MWENTAGQIFTQFLYSQWSASFINITYIHPELENWHAVTDPAPADFYEPTHPPRPLKLFLSVSQLPLVSLRHLKTMISISASFCQIWAWLYCINSKMYICGVDALCFYGKTRKFPIPSKSKFFCCKNLSVIRYKLSQKL